MEGIPAALESKWKTEHYDTAEDAFARVAEEGQAAAGPSFFEKAKVSETVLQAKRD
jgi:hypothetical protein